MNRRSIRRLLPVLVAAAALTGAAGLANATAEDADRWRPEEGRELIGTPAPEWRNLDWLQGGPLTLEDLRGRVVLVRFWLVGCPYCRTSAPALVGLHEKYGDRGLTVVGIHHPKSEAAARSARCVTGNSASEVDEVGRRRDRPCRKSGRGIGSTSIAVRYVITAASGKPSARVTRSAWSK